MKKVLLLLLACVYALTGVWAGTIVSDNGTVTLDNLEAGNLATALTDQTVWTSGNASDLNSATKVIFGSKVTLSEADLTALKTLVPAATQLDMSLVTLEEDADIANLETQAVQYLRLPNSMTSAEDVAKMATLKGNNSALKMVGAYDPSKPYGADVAMHSFEANNVPAFISAMNIPTSGNPTVIPRKIRMSGEYGVNDLVNHVGDGANPNFGYGTSAEWDFTGAHFADCTIPDPNLTYYDYNDPFCESAKVSAGTSSNAFYYFSQYAKEAVDIKLPDKNMTHLPVLCLVDLASSNRDGYMALNGMTETEFNAAFSSPTTVTKYYDEEDHEYTGEKYQEGDQWKGKKTETCNTDLTSITPTEQQTYTNTWADNKTYPVGDLTITDNQVTPASFDILLTVEWYYDQDKTQQCYNGLQGQDDNGYYTMEWENGSQVKKYIYPKYTYQDKTDWQYKEYTGATTTSDGKTYGTYDNSAGNVHFGVSTTYTYTFTDCNNVSQTIESKTQLTSYTASWEVEINLTPREVEEYGVAQFAPIESLTIPNCYTDLDAECGKWARIRHLVIGSGMKHINGRAFLKCDFLEDLDFAAGLSDCYVGDQAFDECKSMKHIALSEGIVSLGFSAFHNSQNLESIRLPETLINMGNHCFDNCLALNSITIPGNVDKIGQAAFNLCPFTDIYLTTTDPAKIPQVWSAGTNFLAFDGNCTFYHGHLDGWEGGVDGYKDDIDGKMTWDEAAPFYFMNWNGMPVLHFPSQLAEAVRSQISSTYAMKTKADEEGNKYGLPLRYDMDKRDDIPGADLGSSGAGKYTRDGWAQFMMMKEFTTDPGGDLYFKEYDDVWYTMCFPFDLSDEQLAGAFNETFNIVDFSAVEINKEEKTLTLHFNNVAVTDYKDTNDKHYKRKLNSDGSVIREIDETSKFSYNVYTDEDGQEYHHVTTSSRLSSNKTKTFAPGTSMEEAKANFNANHEVAVMIDGVLATAGHPYMIHPAIGVNDGGTTKKRCNFSGVEWKPQTQWAKIFHDNSRTIDLGIKKTIEELPDSNYSHPGYINYEGQTYTFIGNPKEFADVAQEAIGDEPQVPDEPVFPVKPENAPTEPTEAEITEAPTVVDNPEVNSKYSDDFKELFNTVRLSYKAWDGQKDATFTYTFGEDLVTYDWSEFFVKQDWYDNNYGPWYIYNMTRSNGHNVDQGGNKTISFDMTPLVNYLGANPLTSIDGFNTLKQLAQDYTDDKVAYAQNQIDIAAYTSNKTAWAAYRAALDEYNNWDQDAKVREYNRLKGIYEQAVAAHTTWENKAKAYKVQIPKNAYFLGRAAGAMYPKYYREMAEESYGGERTKGLWPQFTAIILPNAAAVAGIEKTIDGGGALSNSYEIKFNEDFEGDFIDQDDIQTIIEDARKEGVEPKVEYMDIVVNINGQIVRRDTTSFEGLPKGIYIVNGKKYFVK